MAVQAIPQGYHRVNIHLTFSDAKKAIDFYAKAFGFEQHMLMPGMDGKGVMHAELRLGDTTLFLADDMMGSGKTVEAGFGAAFVPHIWGGPEIDATWKRAIDAGCKEVMPLALQFWGDRYGQVVDPFGLRWAVATHVEDVSPEEMKKRAAKQFGGG
jgi:PhnB protein